MSEAFQLYTPYSSPTDVSGLLNTSFSSTTNPNYTLVQDIIMRQDSFIDTATGKRFRLNFVQDEYYDHTGVGPRAGMVIFRKYPVRSVQRVEWYDGTNWHQAVQSPPQDPNTLALTGAFASAETFYFYPEKAKIEFYKLRTTHRRQGIRVSYTWGYTSPPDFIRDLSASMSAYEVQRGWGGQFSVAEDVSQWRRDMREKIERLFWQAGVKSSGWVG